MKVCFYMQEKLDGIEIKFEENILCSNRASTFNLGQSSQSSHNLKKNWIGWVGTDQRLNRAVWQIKNVVRSLCDAFTLFQQRSVIKASGKVSFFELVNKDHVELYKNKKINALHVCINKYLMINVNFSYNFFFIFSYEKTNLSSLYWFD